MPIHKTALSNPPPKPLAREEWDFRSCSEEELAGCCYYEYARHDNDVKKSVEQLRMLGHWKVGLYPGDSVYYPDAWFRTTVCRTVGANSLLLDEKL